ncbi:hypothetical protein PRO82_002230 [Candidatus Protochlamydia amoebophila]|nr:hypothetical protein [Candidatus Protochlamydia amoebophila]
MKLTGRTIFAGTFITLKKVLASNPEFYRMENQSAI